jgi:hypothetical protein
LSLPYLQPYFGLSNSLQTAQAAAGGAGGAVGGWTELGRTTLGSADGIIEVDSLADKRYYMILHYGIWNSNHLEPRVQFNSDTGTNYASRYSRLGASDATIGSVNNYLLGLGGPGNHHDCFSTTFVSNEATHEKLIMSHNVEQPGTGAGSVPNRSENVGKWANTSNAINKVSFYDTTHPTNDDFASGSEVVVLGWDPADTHTSNFWEELASVSGDGSSATLDSGTITAKKYLWVQCFTDPSLNSTPQWRVNADSGSNYSERLSTDGGADGTNTSVSIFNIGNTTATPSFSNTFIINNSANEKLFINNWVGVNTAGAGTAPMRRESTTKWANTSSQITSLQNVLPAGVHNSNSLMKVYGSN